MAHIRQNRDRRGYETTALIEAGGARRRGRGQRLLYFFRTPPAVRVGREPFDAEAMRLLEQHNPDVHFDWPRLLKSALPGPDSAKIPQGPRGAPPSRSARRPDRRDGEGGRRTGAPAFVAPVPQPGDPAGAGLLDPLVNPETSGSADARDLPGLAETGEPAAVADLVGPAEPGGSERRVGPIESVEPGSTAGANAGLFESVQPIEAGERVGSRDAAEPLAPRYARLGPEGLRRLRARYVDLSSRLAAQPMEQSERAAWQAQLDRLDPDRWLTPDEVAVALEHYESIVEALRPIVARRRNPDPGPAGDPRL